VSRGGYDRLLELVAENPALEAEEFVEMATDEGFGADKAREWLEEALETEDVIEFDDKHWVVRKGKFTFGEFEHPM